MTLIARWVQAVLSPSPSASPGAQRQHRRRGGESTEATPVRSYIGFPFVSVGRKPAVVP